MFHRSKRPKVACVFGILVGAAALSPADEPPTVGARLVPQIAPAEVPAVTYESSLKRQVQVAGNSVDCRINAGMMPIRSEETNETIAEIFHVSYVVEPPIPRAGSRPLTFCFNGGPGSSSVWLHLGMLGPKRVSIPSDASAPKPPYQIVENPWTLLDATDLVFIDPISTGYSRTLSRGDETRFHGFDQDIESVGQFIHSYVTKNRRWGAPIFLLGESYGCLRAAGLTRHMQKRFGMDLNGVVLISSVVNFQTIRFTFGNDLPYAMFLPSYAATAWYHKRLEPDLQDSLPRTIRQARRFATGRYWSALMQGDALRSEQRDAIAEEIARFAGLPKEYVLRSNLRIPQQRFSKELLRHSGTTVGRLDSRFTGPESEGTRDSSSFDASSVAITGAFTAGIYQYLQGDLGILRDEPYELMTSKVQPWSYSAFENRFVDAGEQLAEAMLRNPHLRVLVASGYFDLATPFLGSEYSFSHLGLPPGTRKNVDFKYYQSGHMIYLHEPSLRQLRRDLLGFYQNCLNSSELSEPNSDQQND